MSSTRQVIVISSEVRTTDRCPMNEDNFFMIVVKFCEKIRERGDYNHNSLKMQLFIKIIKAKNSL